MSIRFLTGTEMELRRSELDLSWKMALAAVRKKEGNL
jgi:hypothetical protein